MLAVVVPGVQVFQGNLMCVFSKREDVTRSDPNYFVIVQGFNYKTLTTGLV